MTSQLKINLEIEKFLIGILLILFTLPFVFASNDIYKPYLHNPTVPKNPGLNLQGTYATTLWPGAATYNYPISVPSGTNGLIPSLSISYNHQSTIGRPTIVGAGWSLSDNYIIRDVNYSFSDTSNDKFKLVLNGQTYNLVYDTTDSRWHTEIESYLNIQNLSGGNNTKGQYWIVKTTDGTTYMFGYQGYSELVSNIQNYAVKWSLDLVTDTHNNNIYYTYQENPYSNDTGAIYLNKIEYNNDKRRSIEFVYESSDRPDMFTVYGQGNKIRESRRLKEIQVKADSNLVRKYVINYTFINSKSFIQSITLFGNDSTSNLPLVSFDYYHPSPGWYYDINYLLPNPDVLKFEANGSDYGVRLVDLNKDGLVDIVKADGKNSNDNQTWINNGTGWARDDSWNIPYNTVDSSQKDTGLRFIDTNGDGLADIVVGDGSFKKTWINNGTGWIENSTWNLPDNANPIDSVSNNFERGVRFEDLNGDGLPDIISATDFWNYAWINTGSGWVQDDSWKVPTEAIFVSYSSGKETGVRIFDINDDGLPDLVQGSSSGRNTWINNGSGWFLDNSWQIPSGMEFINSKGEDEGVRFADFNGDSLIDLTKRKADSERQTWINTGNGFVNNNLWNVPIDADFVSSNGKNKAVRLVDVNGDGLVDLMNGDSSIRVTYTNSRAVKPYLLKQIKNNLGGVNIMDYGISTTINNKGSDNISDMGFNLWVVGKVNEDNKINGSNNLNYNTYYQYQGGFYDYNKREFRGFNKVDEIKQNLSIIRHLFYQNDSLKGKEYLTQIYDNNSNLFDEISYNWNVTINNNYYAVNLIKQSNSLYDGIGGNSKTIEVSYSFDNYGNPAITNYSGDNSTLGDEKSEIFNYIYNLTGWIVNTPVNYSLYDNNGNKIRENYYRYDNLAYGTVPIKGDLNWKESWLNNGTSPIVKYGYDNYGNLVNQTDPKGYVTKYVYGIRDTTNTFVDRVINTKNQIFNYQYDLGTGNLLWSSDGNGVYMNYTYDIFGRVTKEIQPYDNISNPTKEYQYNLDGNSPENILIKQKDENETLDIYYFYDGLGNLIQTKKESENNNQIVNDFYYDSLKRAIKLSNPYFTSYNVNYSEPNLSINSISYNYDPLSRVIKQINQDGSSKNVSFEHWKITEFDENGNKKIYYTDAYDQVNKVIEYLNNNYYTTTYDYLPSGELIRVNDSNKIEVINFSYDSLGRKIYQYNVDSGTWRYSYDVSGNLINQTDSRGINISLSYDELNRITKKNSISMSLAYSYDVINGTLSNISGLGYVISYSYDNRLRKTNETTTIDNKTYKKFWTYDSQDRIKVETLPDGKSINYNYSSGGNLMQISDILTNIDYNVPDKPTRLIYSNSLQTNYSYEPIRLRLNRIKTSNLQDLNYNYDPIGNILGIQDSIKGLNENMTYDKLDRLTYSKRGISGTNYFMYNYSYDNLGSLLNNSGSDNNLGYYYAKTPMHAPSKITSPYPLQTVPSTLTFCKTLSYSNVTYYLSNDVRSCGTCFSINATNVTLNGQGYNITYAITGTGKGILSEGYRYDTIKNINIFMNNQSNTNSQAISFLNCKYQNITNATMFTNGTTINYNYNHGIYFYNTSNSYINNVDITTLGRRSYGIYLLAESMGQKCNDNIINNVFIFTNASNSYGVFFNKLNGDSVSNNRMVNSYINSSIESEVSISSGALNNVFLNCTYLDESVSGQLLRAWYLNVQVNYTNGTAVYQANVSGFNVSGAFQFSELTNLSGIIPLQGLTEYINSGGTKSYDSNYTVNATKNGLSDSKSINLTTNVNLFFVLGSSLPNDTSKFYIKDNSNNPVAWLGNFGNIVLKGNCSVLSNCVAPANSFIIKNSTDDTVSYIDNNGNLCIEKGNCSDESTICNPTRDAFIIRNSTNSNMSYIDFDGDLCLTGRLYQNSNP